MTGTTQFERDINRANEAYMAEDYDRYEELLDRYARKYRKPVWQFEDDCTDVRLLGFECC